MLDIAAKQREKYSAIEAENKKLKDECRLIFARNAMCSYLSIFKDIDVEHWHDEIARMSFLTADAMIKRVNDD